MRDHKNSVVVTLLLLLIVASIGLIANTFAKYVATVNGESSMQVAKWAFSGDNKDVVYTFDVAKTYAPSSLVDDRIAPGTYGVLPIEVNNEHSDVAVRYTVALGTVENKPTNLKFYLHRTGSEGSYVYSDEITPGTTTFAGTLAAREATPQDANIYWNWEFEGGEGYDTADTVNGVAALTTRVPVTITGVQLAPSATAVATTAPALVTP